MICNTHAHLWQEVILEFILKLRKVATVNKKAVDLVESRRNSND